MLFLSHDAGGRGGRRGWERTEEAEKEGRELRTREKGEVRIVALIPCRES